MSSSSSSSFQSATTPPLPPPSTCNVSMKFPSASISWTSPLSSGTPLRTLKKCSFKRRAASSTRPSFSASSSAVGSEAGRARGGVGMGGDGGEGSANHCRPQKEKTWVHTSGGRKAAALIITPGFAEHSRQAFTDSRNESGCDAWEDLDQVSAGRAGLTAGASRSGAKSTDERRSVRSPSPAERVMRTRLSPTGPTATPPTASKSVIFGRASSEIAAPI
mmetsp:Transcript_30367/g.60324  ORF Transcript_30367/g.60324 Transcript_30367/m.60324 type:complete len:219 (-) Transcript_30367:789-1445(-)